MKRLLRALHGATLASLSGCYDPGFDWAPVTEAGDGPLVPAGGARGDEPEPPMPTGKGGTGGAGSGTNNGGSGGSASGAGGSAAAACQPELASPRVLPLGCNGESYFARLALQCADSGTPVPEPVNWRPKALPGNLTVTLDGEVRGRVATGQYELQVEAAIGGEKLPIALELEVGERCWVFAATDEVVPGATTARARLEARRLDASEPLMLPAELPAAASVTSFDLSSDGRFLALLLGSSEPARALRLFRISGGQIVEVPLSHQGNHVAHAFSSDASKLAVITNLNTNPEAPDDTRLSVVELSADMPPVTLEEAHSAGYELGLTWSDASTIQFIGVSSVDPSFFMPQVVSLSGSDLANASRVELFYPLDPGNTLMWFRPVPNGFLVMTGALGYFDVPTGASDFNSDAQALSASYTYSAGAADGQLLLRPPGYSPEPPRLGSGCDRVLAWSPDESTLVCLFEGKLRRFAISVAGVSAQPFDTVWSPSATRRAALSRTGSWLAIADPEHGAFVLPKDAPSPIRPDVPASVDAGGWDVGFSRDERYAWVHGGAVLSVATLDPDTSREYVVLSDRMPEPPECLDNGLPDPAEWCGAPELVRARVVVARDGRHLGFATREGSISIVDMAAPTRAFNLSGPLSSSCSPQCLQFQ